MQRYDRRARIQADPAVHSDFVYESYVPNHIIRCSTLLNPIASFQDESEACPRAGTGQPPRQVCAYHALADASALCLFG
jgi:hypothetical protein